MACAGLPAMGGGAVGLTGPGNAVDALAEIARPDPGRGTALHVFFGDLVPMGRLPWAASTYDRSRSI